MFQKLITLVSRDFPLYEIDIELCKNYFVPLEAKKDELLVEMGAAAGNLYFINSGYMRVYHDSRGVEVTTQLGSIGDFITAFSSFIAIRAAQENVHCVTDCQLLQINKPDLEQLYTESKNWAIFIRYMYNKLIEHDEKRANELLLSKPEVRYEKLITEAPGITRQIPLDYIASYLGVNKETLISLENSRINLNK